VIREALEYIVGLKAPNYFNDGDEGCERTFSDRELKPVRVGLIETVAVTTLNGFCDLAEIQFESLEPAKVVAQVMTHESVALFSKASDTWSRRTFFARADLPKLKGFPFGTFIDRESFVIALQSLFTATPDRDYLLTLASNLTSERVRVDEDDGVSQTVTLSAGVTLKTDPTAVKSRVTLAPYRTFREVEQPASEFVFRLRSGKDEDPPTLALFEADGGTWMLAAMKSIGEFLRGKLDSQIAVIV
jgi:hypothetical protein